MTSPLHDALGSIEFDLTQLRRGFALVGGLAVSAHCEPRFTRDVDIVVQVDDDPDAEQFVLEWRSRGWKVFSLLEHVDRGRLATVRCQRGENGVVVDLLLASSGVEHEIVREATPLEVFPGLRVPLASIAALLALKTLSMDDPGREQDRVDLQRLLSSSTEAQRERARELLRLIEERGYHRNRELRKRFDAIVKTG